MVSIAKQALLVSALTLSACSTTPPPNPTSKDIPLLANTKWREASPSKVTLIFTPSYMAGFGGCNSAGAGYLQDDWSLKLTGASPSTLLGCEQAIMLDEYRLFNSLVKVQTFTITENDRLILFDENKQKLLVLDRDTRETP